MNTKFEYVKVPMKVKKKREKRQFSKILAVILTVIAIFAVSAPFVLSYFDKQPLENLSIAVFSGCVGYLVTYAGKSAFEKHSRNKHGLDEYGLPYRFESESDG
jgi:general stress protein CsbA